MSNFINCLHLDSHDPVNNAGWLEPFIPSSNPRIHPFKIMPAPTFQNAVQSIFTNRKCIPKSLVIKLHRRVVQCDPAIPSIPRYIARSFRQYYVFFERYSDRILPLMEREFHHLLETDQKFKDESSKMMLQD